MNAVKSPEWLLTTVGAVRDLMVKRIEAEVAGGEARRDMEMALEELDVMWEELQGQAALLTRENERYAEFFEHAPDAYLITDAGGNIREANRAALELFKASRDDMLGRPLSTLIPESERVGFLTRTVGLMIGTTSTTPAWRGHVQPLEGAAQGVEFSVRDIPLKKSGIAGLCWLLRERGS